MELFVQSSRLKFQHIYIGRDTNRTEYPNTYMIVQIHACNHIHITYSLTASYTKKELACATYSNVQTMVEYVGCGTLYYDNYLSHYSYALLFNVRQSSSTHKDYLLIYGSVNDSCTQNDDDVDELLIYSDDGNIHDSSGKTFSLAHFSIHTFILSCTHTVFARSPDGMVVIELQKNSHLPIVITYASATNSFSKMDLYCRSSYSSCTFEVYTISVRNAN